MPVAKWVTEKYRGRLFDPANRLEEVSGEARRHADTEVGRFCGWGERHVSRVAAARVCGLIAVGFRAAVV
jgi:hypothetical protein